jgi:hypothetical protein
MFSYVQYQEVKPYKLKCDKLFKALQNVLREKYALKFQPLLIGSGAKKLVTRNGNEPFDLDYNLMFSSLPDQFQHHPQELKTLIRMTLDDILGIEASYGQDSTSAISYKINQDGFVFGLDVGIIFTEKGKSASRLIYNKRENAYVWNQVRSSKHTQKKFKIIKKQRRFPELEKTYLDLKNFYLKQNDVNKSSFVIYTEAVNSVYQSLSGGGKTRMSKVSGNHHTKGQMNHHANQGNPNNGAYRSSRGDK